PTRGEPQLSLQCWCRRSDQSPRKSACRAGLQLLSAHLGCRIPSRRLRRARGYGEEPETPEKSKLRSNLLPFSDPLVLHVVRRNFLRPGFASIRTCGSWKCSRAPTI